jgi:phosphoribosylamine--glycine ligase
MIDKIFGDAGIKVVIEQFLKGFEASVIAFGMVNKHFLVFLRKIIRKLEMAILVLTLVEWEL